MPNIKILLLEGRWSKKIEKSYTTRDIYFSASTRLRVAKEPIEIIQNPLMARTYKNDISQFVNLECNRSGPNMIIFSAHGAMTEKGIQLTALDKKIKLSRGLQCLPGKLKRSIVVLDSCSAGADINNFRKEISALGAIGFLDDVDWVDSTMFILSLILKYQDDNVFELQRARKTTNKTKCQSQKTLEHMLDGAYKSFKDKLGIRYCFGSD